MRANHARMIKTTARAATVALLLFSAFMVVFYAPVDTAMGPIQKLIYLHLPAAIASSVAALLVFVTSLGYLWTRNPVWGRCARAAGVAALGCSIAVLVTGMIWARVQWGLWWTWSPRLTFTLVMCVLYAVYTALQYLPRDRARWETRCAVYGCVAFLDVPLVYLAIQMLPDVHPTSLPLTHEMRLTLLPCYLLLGVVCTDLIASPALRCLGDTPAPPPPVDGHGSSGSIRPQT